MSPILTAPVRRGIPTAAANMAAFFMAGAALAAASAQTHCGARDAILAQLYRNYHERPVAIGLSRRGNVIEVLASEDGATWTILATGPGGHTCVVEAGEHWQRVDGRPQGQGS